MLNYIVKACSLLLCLGIVACSGLGVNTEAKVSSVSTKILLVNTNKQVERYRVAEQSFLLLCNLWRLIV